MADDQPVIIEELAGPRAVLVLAGTDIPEPPVSVGTEQRSSQTWNPGARAATAHVMSLAENRVRLRGRFHDDASRLLGSTPLDRVRQARGLAARFNTCRLVWGEVIVRRGRVVMVKADFIRDKDIAYEIMFEPDERLENYGAVPVNEAAVALRLVRDAADRARETLNTAVVAVNTGLSILGRRR